MMTPTRRWGGALVIVLGVWLGSAIPLAQAPFSAQIQRAFQALGLWPYGGIYNNDECPRWNATTQQFASGTCASGGAVAASSVTAGTFGDGDFAFRDTLIIGLDGSGTDSTPANGHKLISRPSSIGSIATDFKILSSEGFSVGFRMNASYTLFYGGAEDKQLYFSAPSFVLFNPFGKKAYFQSNNTDDHAFQLGINGFSELGAGYRTQTLQAFDGYVIPALNNQPGGHLRLGGGRGTGNAEPGKLIFATSEAGSSGQVVQTYSDKAQITDALQLIATGISRPTCDSTQRFKLWPVAGGAGVADTFDVCTKDGSDAYAWRTLY